MTDVKNRLQGSLRCCIYLVQAVVAQVAHGLLDALRERLASPLDDDLQRHPKHIPVFVLSALDPLYELGYGPET